MPAAAAASATFAGANRADGLLVQWLQARGPVSNHGIPGEIAGASPAGGPTSAAGTSRRSIFPIDRELVSRRHELWRVFDFVWMLHIMDYGERENVNNWLLRGATWLMVVTVLSGAWLLFFAFPRKRKAGRP